MYRLRFPSMTTRMAGFEVGWEPASAEAGAVWLVTGGGDAGGWVVVFSTTGVAGVAGVCARGTLLADR